MAVVKTYPVPKIALVCIIALKIVVLGGEKPLQNPVNLFRGQGGHIVEPFGSGTLEPTDDPWDAVTYLAFASIRRATAKATSIACS